MNHALHQGADAVGEIGRILNRQPFDQQRLIVQQSGIVGELLRVAFPQRLQPGKDRVRGIQLEHPLGLDSAALRHGVQHLLHLEGDLPLRREADRVVFQPVGEDNLFHPARKGGGQRLQQGFIFLRLLLGLLLLLLA